jgi:hypothetical protein
MPNEPMPVERRDFSAQELMERYPPRWDCPQKQVIFARACPPGTVYDGVIAYSRWQAPPLPDAIATMLAPGRIVARPGFYSYAPEHELAGAFTWHVNFADPHLFGFYSTCLFAQDEIQVMEHPALAALREALLGAGLPAVTVEHGQPTPVLVAGAERRCAIRTHPNPAIGLPNGLYGRRNLVRASDEALRHATQPLDPPTVTNVLAIAALSNGVGTYQREEIVYHLQTAHAGWRAAVLEAWRLRGERCPVVIHTGFWGCGAFGGNRVLMTLLQMLAAEAAGVDRLVIYTADASGPEAFAQAERLLTEELASAEPVATDYLIDCLLGLGFRWGRGTSD